jgi:NADPH:quinone reductase-like Zn-dependent oxidoreductase
MHTKRGTLTFGTKSSPREIFMPKVVRFSQIGPADVLQIEDLPVRDPKPGEVRIRVQAIGLNRAEVMFRTGQYLEQPKFPSRIGIEAAGVVEAAGRGVANVRVGDKISVATGQSIGEYGTYGEFAIIPAASAIPYPPNLTLEEAASIWVQYLTAYFAFVDLTQVEPGQSVLITAATGGAGLGAIQIAKLLGASVIATTRSASKKTRLLKAGADHVITTGSEDFLARVKQITGGKGADVIFDPIAGATLPALADAVAWGGQIILYGALDPVPTPYPLWTAFLRNFVLRTYMIYNFVGLPSVGLKRNEEAFSRAVKFINAALASGRLKPIIAKTFPLSEIREAHRYLESNQQVGKVVVTV